MYERGKIVRVVNDVLRGEPNVFAATTKPAGQGLRPPVGDETWGAGDATILELNGYGRGVQDVSTLTSIQYCVLGDD